MDFSVFILVLSLSLSLPSSSGTLDTLRKGSSLHVEKKTEHVLISPNGVFSAGFHSVGDNAFSFSIWFTNSSSRTVVWTANRDQPVNGRASKLSLFKDGNLVLLDGGRNDLWSTKTFSSSHLQLDLLDSGNLVLHTFDGVTLWQSFDSPTDTLLPYQKLTKESSLVSSKSKTNYSVGYYKLYFDTDNILRLGFDGPDHISSLYWPDPWLVSWDAGRSWYNSTRMAVLDSLGHFTSSDKFEFSSSDLGIGPLRRLTLDFDGNLRLYSLNYSSGSWAVSWVAFPQPCKIHGVCGANSLCTFNTSFGGRCSCLPGYKMKTPGDWFFGCEPKFNLSTINKHEVDFLRIYQVDFYGYNYMEFKENTLKRCKEICLNLSDCTGFQYRTVVGAYGKYLCYPKMLLHNGYRSPSIDGDLYILVPRSIVQSYNHPIQGVNLDCSGVASTQQILNREYKNHHKNGSILKLLIWFACALGGIEITCILLVWVFLFKTYQESETTRYHLAAIGFRRFSYTELNKATKGFNEEIGRGGGGVVYKGVLSDRRVAAIKQLGEASQGGEAEFLAEVSTIGRINHMNLIDMWGYCSEGKHRLLVYEYMELGSLAENLYSKALDWVKRFNIAVGTAKGLAYLHEECLEWVLHCDVKPQNILLDDNFQPKVADFGLSKLLNRDGANDLSLSRMRGTRGYMAPEWVFNLPITSKVDVYSYGIVVLEMVTGKDPAGVHSIIGGGETTEHRRLVTWMREKMNEAARIESCSWVHEIVDPLLQGKYNKTQMEILVSLALQCVEEDMDARPTMSEVVEILLSHEDDPAAHKL